VKKLLATLTVVLVSHAQAAEKAKDLFDFSGASGYDPQGGIIAGADGTLYGMTAIGGNGPCVAGAGCGTVYALSPPATPGGRWTMNVLYDFQGGQDGSVPQSMLAQDQSGALYGYTTGGTEGTVFRLTPPTAPGAGWTFKILYIFTNGNDGNLEGVYAPLLISNGTLYGVASGGANGDGTVFALTPDLNDNWSETTLYTFIGAVDGSDPNWLAGFDASGSAFVSTSRGGGTVVRLIPPVSGNGWSAQTISRFKNGARPTSLILADDGSLFGITSRHRGGIAFQLTPPAGRGPGWTRTNIAKISEHGYGPVSLAPAPGGALAGAISGDVDFFAGAVFLLTPPSGSGGWTYSELWNFNRGPDRNPNNVVAGRRGKLYGVMNGGDSSSGSLFELQ
jgi:uncharacterized repeat protein (TIGR03803 family)